MEFRFTKIPHFYLLLGVVIGLVLLLSENGSYKWEISIPLEPSTVHRGGPTHIFPFDPKLWQSDPKKARSILLGAEAFYETRKYAPEFVGDALSCTQCHFNGGRQEGMLGLVGVARHYPHWDARDQREITLKERIQSCFLRSENGKAPPTDDPVLQNLFDYVSALSVKASQENPAWKDFINIPKQDLIPVESLRPDQGKELYAQRCAACHMEGGQGDRWAPPLWGEQSFNDGAGLGRVYTLASFIREAMPLSDPGRLSSAEAQQIASYIDAHERPVFSGKDLDYPDGNIPVDAVYYKRRYLQNPLALKLKNP